MQNRFTNRNGMVVQSSFRSFSLPAH
jgi:hypothetical protein